MKISIGRIVHYRNNNKCVAAICTGINENGEANLTLFPIMGVNEYVRKGREGEPQENLRWHWPERVE